MIEIRIHGRGGQGGVTLAKLIATSRFLEGQSVQAFGLYAAERSGAPVQAFCRYSDEPITNRNLIYEPDHVIVLDPTLVGPAIAAGLKSGGWILINSPEPPGHFAESFGHFRVATVDATSIARDNRLGTRSVPIVNTALAGAVGRMLGFPLAEVEAALEHLGFVGGNLAAELKDLGEDATEEQKEAVKADWQKRHEAVCESGGLHIIGTERHESRRIDRQLRGRSGRQGDPGSSRFFLSLEDDLMRIFAGERVQTMMDRLGMEEDVPIEHGMVTRSVQNAQKKVEERNFDIRKHLLEYDDVMNQQRKSMYALRKQVLRGEYRSVLTDEERTTFTKLNQEYVDKFGFPFIIAVRDHDKASILAAFHRRIDNDRDTEFAEACRQVERIGEFRLRDVLPS